MNGAGFVKPLQVCSEVGFGVQRIFLGSRTARWRAGSPGFAGTQEFRCAKASRQRVEYWHFGSAGAEGPDFGAPELKDFGGGTYVVEYTDQMRSYGLQLYGTPGEEVLLHALRGREGDDDADLPLRSSWL